MAEELLMLKLAMLFGGGLFLGLSVAGGVVIAYGTSATSIPVSGLAIAGAILWAAVYVKG